MDGGNLKCPKMPTFWFQLKNHTIITFSDIKSDDGHQGYYGEVWTTNDWTSAAKRTQILDIKDHDWCQDFFTTNCQIKSQQYSNTPIRQYSNTPPPEEDDKSSCFSLRISDDSDEEESDFVIDDEKIYNYHGETVPATFYKPARDLNKYWCQYYYESQECKLLKWTRPSKLESVFIDPWHFLCDKCNTSLNSVESYKDHECTNDSLIIDQDNLGDTCEIVNETGIQSLFPDDDCSDLCNVYFCPDCTYKDTSKTSVLEHLQTAHVEH